MTIGRLRRVLVSLDRFQERHPLLGFPLAVRQKYSEDQGSYLAAVVTYYVFLSLFPLLLVLTTVLGFVLRGHPHLDHEVVHSTLGQFPVIGDQLQSKSLKGNSLALGLGIGGALWAGMGSIVAAQNAMNQIWGIPFKRRPDFLRTRLRALALLGLLGGGALAATALAGIGAATASYDLGWRVASILISALLDVGLFWLSFRLLTADDVAWSGLRNGAIAAGIAYEALQLLGGFYVSHVLKHASNAYGTFALVIGLISFIYLSVHVTLLAAEASVVASRKLWPRSLSLIVEQPATEADRAALTQRSKVEERRQDQEISVEIPQRRRRRD